MTTISDEKLADGLAVLIARETVEFASPDDLDNFDYITKVQLPVMARGGDAEMGIGLEAFAGTFVALILPEVRKAIALLVRKGLLVLEHRAEAYMIKNWDVKRPKEAKDTEGQKTQQISELKLKEALSDIRAFVKVKGFTDDQADALEGVLLKRLFVP